MGPPSHIISSPGSRAFVITANNDQDLQFDDGNGNENARTRGIYVGNGGNMTVIHVYDSHRVQYVQVQTGTVYPFAVARVLTTNLTAANLIGLY